MIEIRQKIRHQTFNQIIFYGKELFKDRLPEYSQA